MEALQPQDLGVRKPDLVDELELNRDPVDPGHVRLDEGSLKQVSNRFKPAQTGAWCVKDMFIDPNYIF